MGSFGFLKLKRHASVAFLGKPSLDSSRKDGFRYSGSAARFY